MREAQQSTLLPPGLGTGCSLHLESPRPRYLQGSLSQVLAETTFSADPDRAVSVAAARAPLSAPTLCLFFSFHSTIACEHAANFLILWGPCHTLCLCVGVSAVGQGVGPAPRLAPARGTAPGSLG